MHGSASSQLEGHGLTVGSPARRPGPGEIGERRILPQAPSSPLPVPGGVAPQERGSDWAPSSRIPTHLLLPWGPPFPHYIFLFTPQTQTRFLPEFCSVERKTQRG